MIPQLVTDPRVWGIVGVLFLLAIQGKLFNGFGGLIDKFLNRDKSDADHCKLFCKWLDDLGKRKPETKETADAIHAKLRDLAAPILFDGDKK